MQLLIVGGLFAIALIALIALFLVVRSEPRTNDTGAGASSYGEKDESPVPAHLGAEQAQQIPLSVQREEQVQTQGVHTLPVMNGQLHELSAELHDLHQQAQDIEHRLSILTEMMGHIKRSQAGRSSIEEEV